MEANFDSIDSLVSQLTEIRQQGYVSTHRAGDTGVGKTLEDLLGVAENNRPAADLVFESGREIELKSVRDGHSCMITAFTKEPPRSEQHFWSKELIEHAGYTDEKGRQALKIPIRFGEVNEQGFSLASRENALSIVHESYGCCGVYPLGVLRRKFTSKFPELIVVTADTRGEGTREHFWYQDARLLSGFSEEVFFDSLYRGDLVVELRMHLKESGAVRNHGTAWRLSKSNLIDLFDTEADLFTESPAPFQAPRAGQMSLSDFSA